jgi:ABC-2 type transport system permease protein
MANFLLLLFCGVNIPLDVLPGWMEAVGRSLPLTHGIIAARDVAAGASLADVSGLVWTELGIGAAYAAAAYVLFRVLEHESRRSAVLDSF